MDPSSPKPPEQKDIGTDSGVAFFTQPRTVVFHRITIEEPESLYETGNYKTLDISMFSMCAGVFASLLVTMFTVKLEKPLEVAGFIAASCMFGLGTVLICR